MPKKININGSYRLSVCERFIRTHELASGYPMDSYQKGVICTFVDMLNGIGTVNNTDLLTRFIADGTVLFPLAPTNDNDAYLQSFEIDLISGEKMGEYVNMSSSNISVKGAQTTANGQYFEVYKSSADYAVAPGYVFTYYQEDPANNSSFLFGDENIGQGTSFRPNSNGFIYASYNRSWGIFGGTDRKGQVGLLQMDTTLGLYWTKLDGTKVFVAQALGRKKPPYDPQTKNMFFHTSNYPAGITNLHTVERISMYGMGVQFTVDEDTAFNDLSQAIRYYQENILSNDTRRWI